MQDGVAENYTASMLTPYLDAEGRETENRGHSFVEAGALRAAVAALDAAGFQVHVHAIGDRASREALDAVRGHASPDRRHHIAHIQVVHPDDVPRFAGARRGRERPGALGLRGRADVRAHAAVPRPGALAVAVPVRRPPPRRRPAGDGQRLARQQPRPAPGDARRGQPRGVRRAGRTPFLPEQAIDLETAYAAYTSGSAWINRRDEIDGAGVLAPGAAADLVVLDRDPFAGPPRRSAPPVWSRRGSTVRRSTRPREQREPTSQQGQPTAPRPRGCRWSSHHGQGRLSCVG